MMKTITEYRPMIFSEMAAHAEQRLNRRRQLLLNVPAVTYYSVAGFLMTLDTGFGFWQWQFWLMFGPLLVAGEMTIHVLRKR